MQSKVLLVAIIANVICSSGCSGNQSGSENQANDGGGAAGSETAGASSSGGGSKNFGTGGNDSGGGATDAGGGVQNGGGGTSSGGSTAGNASGSSGTGTATGGSTGTSLPPSTPPAKATTSVKTALPALPGMTNVIASQRNDSAGIDFDPIDGAKDYRVYALPNDSDIAENSDGTVTVKDAVYRCAGLRQTWNVKSKGHSQDTSPAAIQTTFNSDYTKDTLGYVYLEAGDGRIPVYALAGAKNYAENDEQGWRETRLKIYTTDTAQKTKLLSQGWRDDGIVFYVPAAASSATQSVYGSQLSEPVLGQGWTRYHQYYYLADSKSSHSKDTVAPAAAFEVLTAAADGTAPLMSVNYFGVMEHTELLAGGERFLRAAYQGNGPLWHLEWSGLTEKTTLVVEALDSMCPFQGFLSPQHISGGDHQPLLTMDELKAASPTGEVFVNGQGDPSNKPKAIARTFVTVDPQPINAGDWDFYKDFSAGSSFGTATKVNGCTDFNCGRWQTPDFDFSMYRIEQVGSQYLFAYGQFLGQFWVAYDDSGGDVTGKVRFTARKKASIDTDASKYLHVTLSVDIVSTDRRYPQLIVSNQDAPVQEGLGNSDNESLLIQPIQGPEMRLEVQAIHGLVSGKPWDVNNQAKEHRLIDTESALKEPSDWPFEHAGMDRMTRFDVYVSSNRLYAFMDGKPAGCTLYPSNFALSGPVTVTFGDVLYHEGAADELVCSQSMPYSFMHANQCSETKRHFDDFGFKSGSDGPLWDDTLFPCRAY